MFPHSINIASLRFYTFLRLLTWGVLSITKYMQIDAETVRVARNSYYFFTIRLDEIIPAREKIRAPRDIEIYVVV